MSGEEQARGRHWRIFVALVSREDDNSIGRETRKLSSHLHFPLVSALPAKDNLTMVTWTQFLTMFPHWVD